MVRLIRDERLLFVDQIGVKIGVNNVIAREPPVEYDFSFIGRPIKHQCFALLADKFFIYLRHLFCPINEAQLAGVLA